MNKGTGDVTVTMRLSKPVRKRLIEQARSRGMLLSAYLREYVEGAIYPRNSAKPKANGRQRA